MHIISTKKNLDYIKIVGCKVDILLHPSKFWSFKSKILVRRRLEILSYKLQIRFISMSPFQRLQATGQVDIRLSQNVKIFRYFHSSIDFLLL